MILKKHYQINTILPENIKKSLVNILNIRIKKRKYVKNNYN